MVVELDLAKKLEFFGIIGGGYCFLETYIIWYDIDCFSDTYVGWLDIEKCVSFLVSPEI